ncbi:alpha-ketoacid dehydrogenase subunit alpha/beta [Pinibacter soli]|uniref:Dehydrogenase E1 component subunit alpha/beta n=1 Tax=Pinibacter soli TaxID=3044211 RepID=A0ABT6RC91_9BACT|nr:dehydrogenase E1 component subunit alpha/beta [Pinibacter soli]MDI3320086.1 dehydrogenase E1 component subunit alpha/beta [Pinibacter soli]
MHFHRKDLTNEQLIDFYKSILLPRMIEEKMLLLLRQGKISKWFSGIGQEAIAVGVALALQKDEWIMPLHRNLGVFTTRNMPPHKLFMQWQGNKEGYSNGRERSFHFGSKEHHICGMISHLGPQLAVADGVALAHVLKNENKVALAFSGEGGTSEGDFHEALNVAAVWDLPVIFLVENNGYGLSTPVDEQFRCQSIVDKAKGYGMEGVQIDGNNLLTVYDTIKGVREYCIENKKPYLIECMTFRMRGHEEASGIKYVPPHLLEEWAQKDPVKKYEEYLVLESILAYSQIEAIKKETKQHIEEELHKAEATEDFIIDSGVELNGVYAPTASSNDVRVLEKNSAEEDQSKDIRFIDAIRDALEQNLEKHEHLVIMGQDIAAYGGAFKITEGFVEKFGKARIRNTPICESAIVGAALGLSLEGNKAVVEMQFADFVTMAFNQIVNNLAKIYYRWQQNADVVIRMPTGAGVGAGPFHSQSNEAWFTHVPGLKVVYPSNPFDAKGLLTAAINDPNPVLFFEHKALYRSISGKVPDAYYQVEIGKAFHVQEGEDLSIITYGLGVHWATEYAAESHLSIDITDLRTLQPLDYDAIRDAVKKTGKVLILHEDTLTGGIGGEIAAWIAEHCFEWLDAPVMRCASLDTPIPFNKELENNFLAKSRLDETVQRLMKF